MGKLRFLLDANVLSELTRLRSDARVIARFKRYREQICTAAPVFHDLFKDLRAKDWASPR